MPSKYFISLLLLFFTSELIGQHLWEGTNPGGGGAIAVVEATADGSILAASDLSGIYKSTDNGLSWEVLGATQGLTETSINCFGLHPLDGNTFLIGTNIGAYKTTDGGNTIYPVNLETSPSLGLGYVESMAMDMTTGNVGYMAHHEWWVPEVSFLKTTDSGENWTIVSTNGLPSDARIVKIMVDHINSEIVYALTGKARFGCSLPNLYRSTDGGNNWIEIADFGDVLDVDLHPTNSDIIYVSTFEANDCSVAMWQYPGGNQNSGAFYKSTDGGLNFQEISDKTGIISVGNNPADISLTDILNPYDWNGNAGTWSTSNGGLSWAQTGLIQNWFTGWATSDNYIYSTSFNGLSKTLRKDRFNPDRLYGSFGQWAWSSIDGGNTLNNISTIALGNDQFITTGLENIEGNCIDVNDQNSEVVYMGGYDLGFWYSLNHGESWKRSLPDDGIYPDYSWYAAGGSNCNIVLNDPARENVVWASFSAEQPNTTSALFKSDEYGENWVMSNTGLDPLGLTMHGLSLDVNSPINNRTLYVTQNGNVYKSINDGESWSSILEVGGLKFTAVDQVNNQIVYAGGENGFWRSMDGGSNWAEVGLAEMNYIQVIPNSIMRPDIIPTFSESYSSPPIDAWQGIFEIKSDPTIEGRVYATAYGPNKGLYRSDDAGTTWTKLYTNDRMRGIAIAPENSDIIYVSSSLSYHSGGYDSSSIGFLVSYDGGDNWLFANEGMAWPNGGRMEIESGSNPQLWAWSPGTGIQRTPIPNYTAAGAIVKAKLLLEGCLVGSSMTTDLNTKGLIPNDQPFNMAPWNYTGTETASSIPANAVDWALIELRSSPDESDIVAIAAGFILSDGTLVDIDGTDGISVNGLDANENYYLVIRTRAHSAVMSNSAIPMNTLYDFTGSINTAYGDNQLKNVGGNYCVFAGDFYHDGLMTITDFNIYINDPSAVDSYLNWDANKDGLVTYADYNLYRANSSFIGVQEIRYE